ncbi:hypothetical protein JZU68_05840, partial [bacterium]|nr:hypothetical protein [bacterium]
MVFKKETNHRVDQLIIEKNTNISNINIGNKNTSNVYEMPGSNIVVRNNTGVNRAGLNVPYQTSLNGNTAFTTTSFYVTDLLLPITPVPYQMQHSVDGAAPIFVEFKKAIEAVNLTNITIKRASD